MRLGVRDNMRFTRKDVPAEWLHLICEHAWPDKQYRYSESYKSEEWYLAEIALRTCSCYKYEPWALNVCSDCKQVKPTNFAHPAKCFIPYSSSFICWDCINFEELQKCPCDNDASRDFSRYYGDPITDQNAWYKSLIRLIPPPADFKPIVIDEDALFAELGIEL